MNIPEWHETQKTTKNKNIFPETVCASVWVHARVRVCMRLFAAGGFGVVGKVGWRWDSAVRAADANRGRACQITRCVHECGCVRMCARVHAC